MKLRSKELLWLLPQFQLMQRRGWIFFTEFSWKILNIMFIDILIDSYSFASIYSLTLFMTFSYHILHYYFIDFSWVIKWVYLFRKTQLVETYSSILARVFCFFFCDELRFNRGYDWLWINKGNRNDVLVPFNLWKFLCLFIVLLHRFESIQN